MKSNEKKPATPNADVLTGKQQASNDLNASNNRYFNNVDISGPFGSSTWTKDANGRMTQNVNLDPDQQRALDDQQALSGCIRHPVWTADPHDRPRPHRHEEPQQHRLRRCAR
jgi:hypothetical protein